MMKMREYSSCMFQGFSSSPPTCTPPGYSGLSSSDSPVGYNIPKASMPGQLQSPPALQAPKNTQWITTTMTGEPLPSVASSLQPLGVTAAAGPTITHNDYGQSYQNATNSVMSYIPNLLWVPPEYLGQLTPRHTLAPSIGSWPMQPPGGGNMVPWMEPFQQLMEVSNTSGAGWSSHSHTTDSLLHAPRPSDAVYDSSQCSSSPTTTSMTTKARATKNSKLACPVCHDIFSCPIVLEFHYAAKHSIHPVPACLKCPDCDRVFTHPLSIRSHRRLHTGEKPYRCTYDGCKKRFTHRSTLRKHLDTHISSKYPCSVCGQLFTQKGNVYRHEKRAHGISSSTKKPRAC